MKDFLLMPPVAAFLVIVSIVAVMTVIGLSATWATERRIAHHWIAHCESVYADYNFCSKQVAEELGVEP